MTRRNILPILILLFSVSAYNLLHAGEEDSPFNTIKVNGKNYVNLADFIKYYSFDKNYSKKDKNITIRNKSQSLVLKINSRECLINGVRLWLNDAPLEYRNSYLLSEIDVQKSLNPVLRAWHVPRRKIQTIILDPGHGGEDRGATGYKNSMEKTLTLDLAKRVEKILRKNGFKTLMTRRTDTYISLQDRSDLANSSEGDIFVSIHFNSAKPDRGPEGFETYCLTPVGLSSTGSIGKRLRIGNFSEEPGNSFDSQNMLLAYLVQQKLKANLKEAEDRGIKRARFFVIKATSRPSILIESGFLSNPSEERRISSAIYKDRLADAIGQGIQRFAGIMNMNTASKK